MLSFSSKYENQFCKRPLRTQLPPGQSLDTIELRISLIITSILYLRLFSRNFYKPSGFFFVIFFVKNHTLIV